MPACWVAAGSSRSPTPTLPWASSSGTSSAELLLGACLLVLACLVLRRRLPDGRIGLLPVALIIGGSLGNLLDRAAGGAVRDFITGPGLVFNIADVALLAGVLLAVLPLIVSSGATRPGRRREPAR